MRLGIDFGTTRIVVASVDRGNYPVVVFEAPDGAARDWFPPLVAVNGDQRLYGWEAWAAQQDTEWTVVRSLKRALEAAGPQTLVEIAGTAMRLDDLLRELASALRTSLLAHSNLHADGKEPLEVMLGVPAHANSNQRFLTAEMFRQAGFDVLGLLNEPSAASVEFGHANRNARESKDKAKVLVYDLGGGTFDVSLVEMGPRTPAVLASEGIATLGGDDFDEILAGLVLDAAGVAPAERDELSQAQLFRLHEECREKKESLHPNTRRIQVDLSAVKSGWPEVSIPAGDFYERCRPLVDETLHAVEDLISHEEGEHRFEALYVTGGGSELPLISRALKEVFGRRVRRSAYTRSATAIGLAIQADAQAGFALQEKFTRYFGVWREAEAGRSVIFDPIFEKGATLPSTGAPPLVSSRRYTPAHNVGHFRYLECSQLTEGQPSGDIAIWDEIRFPFDPALQNESDLTGVPVLRSEGVSGQEVEEAYSADSNGGVSVTITNCSAAYGRTYKLGRWSATGETIVPGRARKKKKAKASE